MAAASSLGKERLCGVLRRTLARLYRLRQCLCSKRTKTLIKGSQALQYARPQSYQAGPGNYKHSATLGDGAPAWGAPLVWRARTVSICTLLGLVASHAQRQASRCALISPSPLNGVTDPSYPLGHTLCLGVLAQCTAPAQSWRLAAISTRSTSGTSPGTDGCCENAETTPRPGHCSLSAS